MIKDKESYKKMSQIKKFRLIIMIFNKKDFLAKPIKQQMNLKF